MKMKQEITDRKLIPLSKTIVVLDTAPLRDIAHGGSAEWVETFAKMARDGYSFSLADATAAELLTQIRSGRIPREGYEHLITLLKTFLNLDFPVLPGKIDLEGMVGARVEPGLLEETTFLSGAAWAQLVDPGAPVDAKGPPLDVLLEEERKEWVEFLERTRRMTFYYGIDLEKSDPDDVAEFLADQAGEAYDFGDPIKPPMGARMHLELRYRFRQMARTAQKKDRYDPLNSRKKNDGIDVDLYKYLILPALAVSTDNGFFNSLNSIQSFQKDWIFRPEELANRWLAGERPQPCWPSELFEDEEELSEDEE